MYISTEDWVNYIEKLSAIDKKAAELVLGWVQKNGFGDRNALIDYAYSVVTTYGEAAGALASAMYDATCELEGVFYEPAEAAPTPEYGEVAKAVNGTLKQSQNPNSVANAAGRLVKRTGADTMLKNAERDGAQFAWVPHGDTCAFCIALASRGWQYISKNSLKNGHAEHIHGNCDCTYAIRHSKDTNVEGYDPDKYLEMYMNSSDGTPKDKINAMRREIYATKKGDINAQKREEYAKRALDNVLESLRSNDVTEEFIKAKNPGVGKVLKEQGFIDVDGEEVIANWIHNVFGQDIVLLADNNLEGILNPDYLWDGKLWDLKSPKSSNSNTIDKRIHHGIRQIAANTGGLIIDFSRSNVSLAEGVKIVDILGNRRAIETTHFIVKKNNEFRVLQVKK